MPVEIRIENLKKVPGGRAVEFTVLDQGKPVFTERLKLAGDLDRVEVRDRIGSIALARAETTTVAENDWQLTPGRVMAARDMLRPKVLQAGPDMEVK